MAHLPAAANSQVAPYEQAIDLEERNTLQRLIRAAVRLFPRSGTCVNSSCLGRAARGRDARGRAARSPAAPWQRGRDRRAVVSAARPPAALRRAAPGARREGERMRALSTR